MDYQWVIAVLRCLVDQLKDVYKRQGGNSDADVDYLFTVLSPLVKRLRKMSALYPGQG